MVTDEERDYMYRVYADDPQARINLGIRRRLAPLLGNDRRRIELMNGLLFSLPGTPVLYYGDEIGMGDNIYLGDRNGVRTPMQWSADRNAGFSRRQPAAALPAGDHRPRVPLRAVNVEAQQSNPNSLLWWMKRLIALRKRHPAFGRGSLEFVPPENRKVLAFVRSDEDEDLLVVANLSRFAQYVELDLSRFEGRVPSSCSAASPFPRIGDLPYLLTLGPHDVYWFALEPEREPVAPDGGGPLPALRVGREWTDIVETARGRRRWSARSCRYLPARRWFGGKGARISTVRLGATIPVPEKGSRRTDPPAGVLALIDVEYAEGDPEIVPAAADGARDARAAGRGAAALRDRPADRRRGGARALRRAYDTRFAHALLDAVVRRRRLPGAGGEAAGWTTGALRGRSTAAGGGPGVAGGRRGAEQHVRRVRRPPAAQAVPPAGGGAAPGPRGRALPHRAGRVRARRRRTLGALEYRRARGAPSTLGVLAGWVPNEGDAWGLTLDELRSASSRARWPAAPRTACRPRRRPG